MRLKNLELNHFRNYTKQEILCSPALNIFWGDNAQGKSNLLEAIYYLGHGQSFRRASDNQLIQWDYPGWRIKAQILNHRTPTNYGVCDALEMVYTRDPAKKRIRLNHNHLTKLAHLETLFPVVLFTPDDLALIKGGPIERRNFLDSLLQRIHPKYLQLYKQYQRNLSQRNYYLRFKGKDRKELLLETYDQELSKLAAHILRLRFEFLPILSKYVKFFYRGLAGLEGEMSLWYLSSLPSTQLIEFTHQRDKTLETMESYASIVENFYAFLKKLREKDREKGYTSIGPHRDDLIFRLADQNMRQFASQGQQRSLVLALRLSELVILEEHLTQRPVLLLDDVFSELDPKRCTALLQLLSPERQAFLTATHLHKLPDKIKRAFCLRQVINGTIKSNIRLS